MKKANEHTERVCSLFCVYQCMYLLMSTFHLSPWLNCFLADATTPTGLDSAEGLRPRNKNSLSDRASNSFGSA
jgi:hypothetical protein